jgi:hypothetical protein
MSKQFEERLMEWGLWYHHNVRLLPDHDLRKQIDFLKRSVDGCLELLALAAKDIQQLEGTRRQLWLPREVEIRGDVRKFG